MSIDSLRADCARCTGLCCVALAFDASAAFSFDKAAEEPCPHLTNDDACGVHEALCARGLSGCASYDCLGAGQYVTTTVLPGVHWRDGETSARLLFDSFRAMRLVHELVELLVTAAQLQLTEDERHEREAWLRTLQPEAPWTAEALSVFEESVMPLQVRAWLARVGARLRVRR